MAASDRLLAKVLGKIVRQGSLTVRFHDNSTRTFGSPALGFPDVAIGLVGSKTARQILADPRLGAAEAFMDGRLVFEAGGIMELIQLIRSNKPWERGGNLPLPSLMRRIRDRIAFVRSSYNRSTSAKSNIAHHYDIGNDLYELMLDPEHMQYSCAYWPEDGMTLGQAQEVKLAHIAAKLALSPGQSVLDIGCGWGGMAIYLAQHTGVTVTGITLSEEQVSLARERADAAGVADRVTFELIDYRDVEAMGRTFDRIVSVGMFEHVGQPQFETFFRVVHNLLKPDGVMLLHTIGRMGGPSTTDAFTSKYIFPGGYIPALSETVAASEKVRLMASDIEMLRLHYAKTLRCWYERCMAHKAEIEALYDPRFFRMWTFYLAGSTAAFETGAMCNYQIQYLRQRRTVPLSRDYMAQAEAGLTKTP